MRLNPVIAQKRMQEAIKAARLVAGLTLEGLSAQVGLSASALSRIEAGARPMLKRNLPALAEVLDLTPDRRAELVELAEQAAKPPWWESYGDAVAERNDAYYLGLAGGAESIRSFEPEVFHELLWTPDYGRALGTVLHAELTAEQGERRLALLAAWQEPVLAGAGPRVEAVVTEAVLRRRVGGPSVLREQLAHVLALVESGAVDLRVITDEHGAHPGMGGRVCIVRVPSFDQPELVFVRDAHRLTIVEKEHDTATIGRVFERTRAAALSGPNSADLIGRAIAALD